MTLWLATIIFNIFSVDLNVLPQNLFTDHHMTFEEQTDQLFYAMAISDRKRAECRD
jgi:hypothetical protein